MENIKKYIEEDYIVYYTPFTQKNLEFAEEIVKKGGRISLLLKKDKFMEITGKKIGGGNSHDESKITIPYRFFHYKFLYLKNNLKNISEQEKKTLEKESEIKTPKNSIFVEGLKSIYDKISNTYSNFIEKKEEPTLQSTPQSTPQFTPQVEPEKSNLSNKNNIESPPLLKISINQTKKLDEKVEKMRGTLKYKEEKMRERCEGRE